MSDYDPLLNDLVGHKHSGEEIEGGNVGGVDPVSSVQFDILYSKTGSEPIGSVYWNEVDGTFDFRLKNNTTLQVGQEMYFYGKASGAIANGELCEFAGVQGDHILVKKAVAAEIIANPHYLVGVATQNITNGEFGYITWFGKINGVYTKTPANNDSVDWVAGDILYFNNSTGQLTKTEPTAPNRRIIVAAVIKEQTGSSENGIILVRPTFGTKLTDLDDVDGSNPDATGDLLTWNNTSSTWERNSYNITDYVTTTTANSTYLKLDASNDPVTGDLKLVPAANSTTTFQIFKQDGTTNVLNVDTTNGRIGIGLVAPTVPLHVFSTTVFSGSANDETAAHFTLQQSGGTAGNGNFSSGLVFTKINSSRRGAAIAAVQTSTDEDQLGLAFFTHGSATTTSTLTESMRILHDGKVGILTTTPTNDLSFSGQAARTIWLERHTTTNTAGNALTIQAGGATSAATDKNGGSLALIAGISTGTGTSSITLRTADSVTTGAVSTIAVNFGGQGYAVNDVLTITGGTGDATATVASVTNGAVATVTLTTPGTTYSITNANATTVSPSKAKFGGMVGLNGTTDAYSAVDGADFQPTTAFTIGGWFKTVRSGAGQVIFASYTINPNVAGIKIQIETSNKISLYSGKNTGAVLNTDYKVLTSAGTYTDGAWHHILCGWDGANLFMEVDDVAETPVAWANAPAYNATNNVRVGCVTNVATNQTFFTGLLDEVYGFHRALTSGEITTLYTNELNTQAPLLAEAKWYYRFESGALTADTTAGAHTLTAIGAPFEGPGAKINVTAITGTADNTPATKWTISGNGTTTTTSTMRNTASSSGGAFTWTNTISPPVDTAFGFRTLNFINAVGADSSATFANTNAVYGLFVEQEVRTSGLQASMAGIYSNGFKLRTSSAATTQATTVYGVYSSVYERVSGTTTATITNGYGFLTNPSTSAGLTATNLVGYAMTNPAAGTITTLVGLDIPSLTRAATNIGIRIAAPSGGATANYALQLSDTGGTAAGGITFGTDTTLYRNAANSLKTDDTLVVSASSTAQATAFEGVNIAATKTSGANDAVSNNGLKLAYSLAGTFDYSGVNSALSASFYHNGSGLIGDASGMYFIGGIASTGSMTALDIVRARPFGAGAGTIGTLTCFRAYDMGATGTPTTMYGFKVDTTTGAVGTNKYGFWCGNIQGATNNYAILTNAGSVIFNEGGDANSDFRVESDTNANSLNHDATYGVWGFGIAPNSGIHRYSNYQHAPSANATVYGVLNDYYINPQAVATYTMYGSQTSATSLGAQNIANLYGARFDAKPNVGVTHAFVAGGYFSIAPNVATSVTSVGTNNSVGLFQFAKSGAGTFTYTSIKMIDIASPLVSDGTLSGTTLYGLYVNSLTTSGATANYAIYTNNGIATFNTLGDADADFNIATDTENSMFRVDAGTDQIFLGGTTNGIQIDKGGEMTFIGTATRWDDLRIEPVPRSTGVKAPTFASWAGGLYLYDFNDAVVASEKEVFFTVQLPHGWKEGSAVEPHVHWVNKTAGTAGHVVRWGLEYSKAKIGGTFSTTTTTVYATTIAGGGDITVANEHMLTDFASIDMTGDTISTVLICRLFRNSSDAADTYTGTAGLLYIDWHYEIDSVGSKTELAK